MSRTVRFRPIHTTIVPTLLPPSVESESDAPPACDALLRALGNAAIALRQLAILTNQTGYVQKVTAAEKQ